MTKSRVVPMGLALALALLLSPNVAVPLEAQSQATAVSSVSPEARKTARDAIGQIRSPFCPGFMLEVCTSAQAGDWRDTIRVWANAGMETDSIVELVIAEFGEEYRGLPKPTGRGLLAWLAPPIAFLIGLIVVVLALRSLRAGAPAPASVVTTEDEDRVREALAELERAEGPLA